MPSVLAMRHKNYMTTNMITKYKAWLSVHGGKQEFGVNYYETHAPIVMCFAIRLMIVFAIIFGWALHQGDFILANTQAPIEVDIYMEIPQGILPRKATVKSTSFSLLATIMARSRPEKCGINN